MVTSMEKEIKQDYYLSQRVALLKYILLDPAQQRRLRISKFPASYTPLNIQAPVPWHNSYIMASQRIEYNLFITHPLLRALRHLWEDR